MAHHNNLAALALCDHDTVDGVPEFYEAARVLNFPVIGGVELSLEFVGTTHLLGLGVKAKEKLPAKLEEVKNFRLERNQKLHQRLAEIGLSISWERLLELSKGGQMGKPHFAKALCEAGYCHSLQDAFERYLGKGKPGYIDKVRPLPEKALTILREASFAPVLAHPISLKLPPDEFEKVMPKWKDWGLIGLEAYHPDHSQDFSNFIVYICKKYGLVATAGSDFHGANKKTPLTWVKTHSPLGQEVIEALICALG
jgi:predicted metal-dependent phosphoesterase TrpH